jgi:uncharacterized protein (DUF488 family)
VGHSNRSEDEFLALLGAHGIEAIADVRRFPGSRKHPQFGGEALEASLARQGIAYAWIPALGGRRRPAPDSPNDGWRNPSFRAYADHTETEAFAEGLVQLLNMVFACRTALMCSEVLWWRCHRALICDVLLFEGVAVTHILGLNSTSPHRYTAPAHVSPAGLDYSARGAATARAG